MSTCPAKLASVQILNPPIAKLNPEQYSVRTNAIDTLSIVLIIQENFMKILSLLMSFLLIFFASLGVHASGNLDQAIKHSEAALKSEKVKSVADHAAEAKKYAQAAKNDKDRVIDGKHLDEGIKCLSDAMKDGEKGDADEAKKAVKDAIEHFKQAIK